MGAGIGLPVYIKWLLRSYFTDRAMLFPTDGRFEEKKVIYDVSQGSILGPTLWNIIYDGLLRLRLQEGSSLVGFAYDVGLVIIYHNSEWMKMVVNESLTRIAWWISNHGLELAFAKSEAVMLTRKWAFRKPVILSGSHVMLVKRSVKYLGVLLDSKLTFTHHLRAVATPAIASVKAVAA